MLAEVQADLLRLAPRLRQIAPESAAGGALLPQMHAAVGEGLRPRREGSTAAGARQLLVSRRHVVRVSSQCVTHGDAFSKTLYARARLRTFGNRVTMRHSSASWPSTRRLKPR